MNINSSQLIPKKILKYFESHTLGPMLSVMDVIRNPEHELYNCINTFLENIDKNLIKTLMRDDEYEKYKMLVDDNSERGRRISILIKLLNEEIPKRRLALLSSQSKSKKPPPYNHPALSDLKIDENFLVPIDDFKISDAVLIRKGYGFSIVPPNPSVNSGYWFTRSLCKMNNLQNVKVRIDPLLIRPIDQYIQMGYKMWWYGRQLNWGRLSKIKNEEHGRWLPDSVFQEDIKFTDFVWSPHGNELHLKLEELPKDNAISIQGSRYLHSIYIPANQCAIHLDASVRVYSKDDLIQREKSHVRNCGRVGRRIKIFQIDDNISQTLFTEIISSYFVWNLDVMQYFSKSK